MLFFFLNIWLWILGVSSGFYGRISFLGIGHDSEFVCLFAIFSLNFEELSDAIYILPGFMCDVTFARVSGGEERDVCMMWMTVLPLWVGLSEYQFYDKQVLCFCSGKQVIHHWKLRTHLIYLDNISGQVIGFCIYQFSFYDADIASSKQLVLKVSLCSFNLTPLL